jgi:hypothetical protein
MHRLRFCAVDTESYGTQSDRFRLGSVYWKDRYGAHKRTFHSQNSLWLFCARFDVAYCYNIKYDSIFTRNWALEHAWIERKIESSATLLGVIVKRKDKRLVLKDFMRYSGTPPTTLENFAKTLEIGLDKILCDFDNTKTKLLREHCERDAEILYNCISTFRNIFFKEFHVDAIHPKIYSIPSL